MNRIERLSKLVTALSVGLGVVLANQANGWLIAQGLSGGILIPITLAVAGITILVTSFVAESILEACTPMRSLLLGRQFVEGTWMAIIRRGKKIIWIEVTRIEAAGRSLRVAGDMYGPDGSNQGTYASDMVVIDWPRFKFKYTEQPAAVVECSLQGYEEILFIERDGKPLKFTGFYIHLTDGLKHSIEGWRVEDEAALKRLDDPKQRSNEVLEWVRKTEQTRNAAVNTRNRMTKKT